MSRADCMLGRFITGEIAPENTRDDYDQQGPASIFACADGYVYLYMTNGAHWVGLKELMGRPPWLDEFEDDWLEFSVTPDKVAAFRRGFAAWIRDSARIRSPKRRSDSGFRWCPSKAPTICSGHRSTATAASSPTSRIRCWAARPIPVPYLLSASPAEISPPHRPG